jgi:hypothetical protein
MRNSHSIDKIRINFLSIIKSFKFMLDLRVILEKRIEQVSIMP